jgi:hypothetical protein
MSISNGSEKRINEGCDHRTLAQHKQAAEDQEKDQQGYEPKFLACEQEFEQFGYNRHRLILKTVLSDYRVGDPEDCARSNRFLLLDRA